MATTVYFATNRNQEKGPKNFGPLPNLKGIHQVRFGKCKVQNKKVQATLFSENLNQKKFGSIQMFEGLKEEMLADKPTVFFVHGFNVSFNEAMQSAAGIKEKLLVRGFDTNIVVFSWPSDGKALPFISYKNDRTEGAASGEALARGLLKFRDFLHDIEDPCNQGIHLMAHSMGNYVLRNAVQQMRELTPGSLPRLFDQVFLMAPDEDDDAFEHDHKLKLLPRLCSRVNVYFNRKDKALTLSDHTKGNPERLGHDGPDNPFMVSSKITQVDCTQVYGRSHHSYYWQADAVIDDYVQVMQEVEPEDVTRRRFVSDRNRYVIIRS